MYFKLKNSTCLTYLTLMLFLVLSVAFPGCGPKPESPSAAGGESSPQQEEVSRAPAATVAPIDHLLPAGDEVPAWSRAGEVRTFVPENLWEYINGGAEGYLAYDFRQVVTADYENREAGIQAVVDIYAMADRLCGFGIYSAERSPGADFIEIGSQGYLTGNALHFHQGHYYIKATAFQEGEQVGEQLKKLADVVAGQLDGKAEAPPELGVFPQQGLIPNTERFVLRDVLGHSELTNGFTAEYKLDDREFKLFFLLHDNMESSSASYLAYKSFMEEYTEGLEDHSGEDVPWFMAEDPYYGKVVTMEVGRVMIGVMGLDDPERVNEYLKQMKDKLTDLGLVV